MSLRRLPKRRLLSPAAALTALLLACGCDGGAGSRLDRARQVSESGYGSYEVDLAAREGQLAVAWYDTRDGNAEIYVRLLHGAGVREESGAPTPKSVGGSVEYRLTDSEPDSYEASIDALADGFAVAWYEKPSEERLEAQLGLWTPEQGFRWRHALAAPGDGSRNPVVAASGDRVFCAWIEKAGDSSEAVRGGWFGADGTPLGDPVRLGPASATTWNLNAAIDGEGAAVVVYDAEAETEASELFAARLLDGRVTLTRLTDDDGRASKYPDLAFAPDGVALTWFDERDGNQEVYLYVGSDLSGGVPLDRSGRRITQTSGHSIGAYVAHAADRYGLAWSDDTEGSYDVYFESFRTADGAPTGPMRRLTTTRSASLIPAIRPYGEGFAVAWTEVTRPGRGMHDAAARAGIMLTAVR